MYKVETKRGKYTTYFVSRSGTTKTFKITADEYKRFAAASEAELAALWTEREAEEKTVCKAGAKKHPLIVALDTETAGFRGDILSVQLLLNHPAHSKEPLVFIDGHQECVRQAFDYLNKVVEEHKNTIKDCHIFIHNAAFDLPRICHALPAGRLLATTSGSAFVSGVFEYNGTRYMVKDTMRMMAGSLRSLAKSFAPHLPKLEISHFEGFCPTDPAHIEYAKRDVEALMAILEAYAKIHGKSIDQLRSTAPSEAFAKLTGMVYDDDGVHVTNVKGAAKNINLFFQNRAYTGGRIHIKERMELGCEYEVVSFDITSSYPYEMMRQKFPLGVAPKVAKRRLPNNVGRYFVHIRVEGYNADMPMLPYRVNNAETGIKEHAYFPRGDFETIITDDEYNYFLENNGGAKHEVIEFIYWHKRDCHHYFRHYVEEWKRVKEEGDAMNKVEKGSGDAKRTLGKLMLNSPYGKLAQKYDMGAPVLYILGQCGLRKATEEEYAEFGEDDYSPKDRRMAYNAAFITAGARINLLKPFLSFGVNAVLYCDTDSAKILKEVFDRVVAEKGYPDFLDVNGTGEFGKWKNEGTYWFIPAGAKVYMLKSFGKDGKPEYELKAKGFPTRGIEKLVIGEKEYHTPEITNDEVGRRWEEDCKEMIYNGLLQRQKIIAHYVTRPTAFKTAMTGSENTATESVQTLFDPTKTTGYDYDEASHSYRIKQVKDCNSLLGYSHWTKHFGNTSQLTAV